MVDAVTTQTLIDDGVRHIIQITNVSDTTGESGVDKIDISEITAKHGYTISGLQIDRVVGNVSGFTTVVLAWNADTNRTIVVLAEGQHDHNYLKEAVPLRPTPADAGYNGDLLLTTTGNASGDSYNLTIYTTIIYEG